MFLLLVFRVVKKLWQVWEIQGLVLCSLSLQILLIFTAGLRLRRNSWLLSFVLWSAYLLADSVATFALGYLSQNQQDHYQDPFTQQEASLHAFWAPFLLLHLGGPDTITSFSLEDNELWRRHLLGLVFQVSVAIYVFAKSFHATNLLAPSLLMFASGILKFGERTWALRGASMDCLRSSMVTKPDPGPNYAKFMEEYHSSKNAGLHASIDMVPEGATETITFDIDKEYHSSKKTGAERVTETTTSQNDLNQREDIVYEAYQFYGIYRRLVVDLILSFRDRIKSQSFFQHLSTKQAFKVIEVELFFLYEELHSKAAVIHTAVGRFLRLVTLVCTLVALVLFYLTSKKEYKRKTDVAITYFLLVGAVGLEVYAVALMVVSHWTYAQLRHAGWVKTASAIFGVLDLECIHPLSRPWWSNSVGQCNLIGLCLEKRPLWKEWIPYVEEITWIKLFRTTRAPVSDHLKRLIFNELKKKANSVTDARSYKRFSTNRGEWTLQLKGFREDLGWSVDDAEFDESILLWHIATTICFNDDGGPPTTADNGDDNDGGPPTTADNGDDNDGGPPTTAVGSHCCCKCCYHNKEEDGEKEGGIDRVRASKQMSDYMLYLLVAQPFMLPAGIGQIRFGDTGAEARNFFLRSEREIEAGTKEKEKKKEKKERREKEKEKKKEKKERREKEKEKKACELLCEVQTDYEPILVKGDRSKSVLFDGCRLAKALLKIKNSEREHGRKQMWRVISAVWVEMLCFAASKCRGNYHARQLTAGGELLTMVWFLMAHVGIGEQYRIEAGHARAKLIVEK